MTARERRATRLLCLWVVVAGILGTVLAVSGIIPPNSDGTMLLPLSAAGGIIGLWVLRPQA